MNNLKLKNKPIIRINKEKSSNTSNIYLPKLNEKKKPNIPVEEPKYKNIEISDYETSFYKNIIKITKLE